MKMKTLTAIAMVALLGAFSANATVIFNDTFTNAGDPSPINDLSLNITNRQALGTTMSTYSNSGSVGYMEGNSDSQVLMRMIDPTNGTYNTMNLDTDFGSSLAGEVWTISYDGIFTNNGTGSFQGWVGLHIGNTSGFGGEFTLLLREWGGYAVYTGFDLLDTGGGLVGLGEYRVEATFNEVANTVSIVHIAGGTTSFLGSYPLPFSGGSRFVQFRSHCDTGLAGSGALWDNMLDNLTIETHQVDQSIVFSDIFDGGLSGINDLNFNLATRQAAGTTLSGYTRGGKTNGYIEIYADNLRANMRMISPASGDYNMMSVDADFGSSLTGEVWTISYDGVFTNSGTGSFQGWVALFAGNAGGFGDDFGLLLREWGGYAVLNGTTTIASGGGLIGLGEYRVEATFNEEANTVSIRHIAGGVTTDLGTYPQTFSGGSRLFQFRSHCDSGDAGSGALWDNMLDNLLITIIPPPPTYEEWVLNDTSLDVGVNDARTDDPDTDSMDNLLEYALGGDPLVDDAVIFLPTSYGIMVGSGGTNYLNYVYRRRVDAALRGLSYRINFKFDLVFDPWTDGGSSFETSAEPIDSKFESVDNMVPTVFSDDGFVTLKVTEN